MKPLRPLGTALLLLAAALAAYVGLRIYVNNTNIAVANLVAEVKMRSDENARIAAARAATGTLAAREEEVASYFVPQSSIVAFINDLQSRGAALGAAVDITSVATAGAAKHPALAVAADIRGSFDAVMRTVGSIEYAPYDVSVTSLTLGYDGKGAWVAQMTILVVSAPPASAS